MKIEELSEKTKICLRCNISKPILEFNKRSAEKDGYSNWCKICYRIYRNKQKKIERNKRHIVNDGTKLCKDCNQELSIDNFHIDRDSIDGRNTRCSVCARDYKKKLKNYKISRRVSDANGNCGGRGKTRNKNIKDKITTEEVVNLLNQQHNKCFYCQVDITDSNISLDHATPLSKDGKNIISNIDIVCKDCNMLKGIRTKEEFLKFLNIYILRFNKVNSSSKANTKYISQAQRAEIEPEFQNIISPRGLDIYN